MGHPYALSIDTDLPAELLIEQLRRWEPWGHRIEFSNGVTTAGLARRRPFADNPLQKLSIAARAVPFDQLAGGTLLDIGCNSGYNCIAAARRGLRPVGIDVDPRHVAVARFLSDLAGVEGEYLIGNAETFTRPAAFDVVLHFGTLYHLPSPLASLQAAATNLKPGGWLALETQCYDHPADPNLCYWMHLHNNDPTNFWALSGHVLNTALRLFGFVDVDEQLRVSPPQLAEHMSRVVLTARKAG